MNHDDERDYAEEAANRAAIAAENVAETDMLTVSCGGCGSEVLVTHREYHAGGVAECGHCDAGADLAHVMRHVGCYCEEDE